MQIDSFNNAADRSLPLPQVPGQFANFSPRTKAAPPDEGNKAAVAGRLAKLERVLSEHNISLKFSTDDSTKSLVVQLVDEKTGEAINQFPSEVSLTLAANFIKLQGNFVDKSE